MIFVCAKEFLESISFSIYWYKFHLALTRLEIKFYIMVSEFDRVKVWRGESSLYQIHVTETRLVRLWSLIFYLIKSMKDRVTTRRKEGEGDRIKQFANYIQQLCFVRAENCAKWFYHDTIRSEKNKFMIASINKTKIFA